MAPAVHLTHGSAYGHIETCLAIRPNSPPHRRTALLLRTNAAPPVSSVSLASPSRLLARRVGCAFWPVQCAHSGTCSACVLARVCAFEHAARRRLLSPLCPRSLPNIGSVAARHMRQLRPGLTCHFGKTQIIIFFSENKSNSCLLICQSQYE